MDKTALYKLSYGVFMLGTRSGDRMNGCITNTCMQVANSPTRIAISVLNTNCSCDLIKESGVFALSVLSQDTTYQTIKHFGMQSGRDVDKLADLSPATDVNGCPYLEWQTCAVISGKVIQQIDLGTHTMFIAEVVDAIRISDRDPLTYADYQNNVKPGPQKKDENRKIVGWRCKICMYEYEGSELPSDFECPLCGHGPDDFEPIYG